MKWRHIPSVICMAGLAVFLAGLCYVPAADEASADETSGKWAWCASRRAVSETMVAAGLFSFLYGGLLIGGVAAVDTWRSPSPPSSVPLRMTTSARSIVVLVAALLYAAACATPAIVLAPGCEPLTGLAALYWGWLFPVPWVANLCFPVGLACQARGYSEAAALLGALGAVLGLTVLGAGEPRVGYFLWEGGFLVLAGGPGYVEVLLRNTGEQDNASPQQDAA